MNLMKRIGGRKFPERLLKVGIVHENHFGGSIYNTCRIAMRFEILTKIFFFGPGGGFFG